MFKDAFAFNKSTLTLYIDKIKKWSDNTSREGNGVQGKMELLPFTLELQEEKTCLAARS